MKNPPRLPIAPPALNLKLTEKEVNIVKLVAEGMKNKEIADALGMKVEVLKNYLRVIYDKTGSWNRTELTLWWLKRGEKA